jgi:hypothetical protein
MVTKKRRGSQSKKSASDKRVRHGLARLKKLGLYSGDVRKSPTKYGRGVYQKYSDVLSKRAAVVTTKRRREARAFADVFRVVRKKVVVPKSAKEFVRYNKKTGEIYGYSVKGGQHIKALKVQRQAHSVWDLKSEKPGRFYRIPFGHGGSGFTFDNRKDLLAFMEPGYTEKKNPYRNWWKFVEVIDLDTDDSEE